MTKQEDFGFTFATSKRWRETFADALAAKFDTASNLRDMDKEGVDIGVGADHLMVATDYPHSDCIGKFPDRTVGDLTGSDHLSQEARRKILWDNPKRFYGLEV